MLTHIDEKNLPSMVDITNKSTNERTAMAVSQIQLPDQMRSYLHDNELTLNKGPVFQTAIIAGTQAVKKTYELIPFCHQIPIESCKFSIEIDQNLLVTIICTVKTTYKTGVEMEALCGANIAALTIYDMCKAITHDMTIKETKLLHKSGGKRLVLERPVYGLVLTGGKSERMGKDKALLEYRGKPHAQHLYELLKTQCEHVYLSVSSPSQWHSTPLANLPVIADETPQSGPAGAILSAFNQHPQANWLVVACDLPYLNQHTLTKLISNVDPQKIATCYKNPQKGFPEALCAFYTPQAKKYFEQGISCPVRILKEAPCKLLDVDEQVNLANINYPDEFEQVQNEIN